MDSPIFYEYLVRDEMIVPKMNNRIWITFGNFFDKVVVKQTNASVPSSLNFVNFLHLSTKSYSNTVPYSQT